MIPVSVSITRALGKIGLMASIRSCIVCIIYAPILAASLPPLIALSVCRPIRADLAHATVQYPSLNLARRPVKCTGLKSADTAAADPQLGQI